MTKEKLDYWTMLFQISAVSNYSDKYLLSLTEEELERLYREKVDHG